MSVPPWLVLVAVASLAVALAYQLLSRRYGWRVLVYWAVIGAGALGAEVAAETLGINALRIGDLRVLPDATGALGAVAALWFLGM